MTNILWKSDIRLIRVDSVALGTPHVQDVLDLVPFESESFERQCDALSSAEIQVQAYARGYDRGQSCRPSGAREPHVHPIDQHRVQDNVDDGGRR